LILLGYFSLLEILLRIFLRGRRVRRKFGQREFRWLWLRGYIVDSDTDHFGDIERSAGARLGRDLVFLVLTTHHDLERFVGQRSLQPLSSGATVRNPFYMIPF